MDMDSANAKRVRLVPIFNGTGNAKELIQVAKHTNFVFESIGIHTDQSFHQGGR